MRSSLQRGGVAGAALSLSVATIGAGILTLPSAFAEAGILSVVVLLLVVALFTVASIDFLVLCAQKLGLRSYEDISRELLGCTFEEGIRWILIFYNLGAAAGYVVVVREVTSPLLPLLQPYAPWLENEQRLIFTIWAAVMLPLACIPKVSSLRFTSLLAISAAFCISAAVVYRYFFPLPGGAGGAGAPPAPIRYVRISPKALLVWPILMFSFDCQSLVFQIHSSLEDVTRRNMARVSALSMALTGTVYFLVGLFGYLSHGEGVHENILRNYDPLRDRLFAAADLFYCVTLCIAYVLMLFPSRDAIFILLYGYNDVTGETSSSAIGFTKNLALSIVLAVVSGVVAMWVPSILFIISLLGGLCSGTLCFTYPAAFRIRLHVLGVAPCSRLEKIFMCGMLALGISGAVFGTAVAFITLW